MVEEMAGLFFSPEMIAVNLEMTEEESEYFFNAIQVKDIKNVLVAAYFKGWLEAEISLRRAIKQSAMNGSSPSQQQMLNYQKEGKVFVIPSLGASSSQLSMFIPQYCNPHTLLGTLS